MRSQLLLSALLGVLASTAGAADGWTRLNDSLKTADQMTAVYTLAPIGQAGAKYQVTLQKPNLLRIDTPTRTTVADGTKVFVFDKTRGAWASRPQTADDVKKLLAEEPVSLWSGFFGAPIQPARSRSLPNATKRGQSVETTELLFDGGARKVTLYTDPENGAPVAGELTKAQNTVLLITESVNLGAKAQTLAWRAPADTREIPWAELEGIQWLTDLEAGLKAARSSGKLVFVDFMATWCGPCKQLEAEVFKTPEFQKYSDRLVFVKIDVDQQPALTERYGVTAMPTQMVLNAQGGVVKSTVGYGGKEPFFTFLNAALALGRR